MIHPQKYPQILMAGLALAVGIPAHSQITVSAPETVEGDEAPVNAVFQYSLPETSTAAVYQWALLPQGLAAGRDFTPLQSTMLQAAGPIVTGTVEIPVLSDLEAEENGGLHLIVKPPSAATWADALSSPAIVPEFSGANGTVEVVSWQDSMVLSRRLNPSGSSFIDTWARTAGGGMTLLSTLQAPASSPTAFHAQYNAFTPEVITASQPGGILTWRRDSSVPEGWRRMADLPFASPAQIFLTGDRMFLNILARSAIFRTDPYQPAGWRQTGVMEAEIPFEIRNDLAAVFHYGQAEIWERSRSTEDLWNHASSAGPTEGRMIAGTAEGMVLVMGPGGMEIHERSLTGPVWSVAGTLPITNPSDDEVTAAVAGDWIAVAKVKRDTAPTMGGEVQLFLRDTVNRGNWNAVGVLNYPEARASSKFWWDGRELVMSSYRNNNTSAVVTRHFQGGRAAVKDNDRSKLSVAAAVQLEPESGNAPAEIYAELPLPADAGLIVTYSFPGGTAVAGRDFLAVPGSLSIPTGSARAVIPVTLLNDGVPGPDKTLTVRLETPGQPAVEVPVTLRNTDPVAVVTATATPLMEGYLQSTVTVKQTPATGGALPAAPVPLAMKVAGFPNPLPGNGPAVPPGVARNLELATAGADLAAVTTLLPLSANAPALDFTISALQDSISEPEFEHTSAVFTGGLPLGEAGSFGIGLDAGLLRNPAFPPDRYDSARFTAGGDWVFSVRQPDPSGAAGYSLGFHLRSPHDAAGLELVQSISFDSSNSINGFDSNRIEMASDGELLAVSTFVSAQDLLERSNHLAIYQRTGPPNAPWQLSWEWNGNRLTTDQKTWPVYLLDGGFLAWGPYLIERSSGPWTWRLRNDAVVKQLPFGSTETVLASDARRVVVSGPAAGEATVYRRTPGAVPGWESDPSIRVVEEGFFRPIGAACIRGQTLYLLPQSSSLKPYRRGVGGIWQPDASFPRGSSFGAPLLMTESTVVFPDFQGQETVVLSRVGNTAAPWVKTAALPQERESDFQTSDNKVIYRISDSSNARTRLRIYEPGLVIPIVDDDSLTFEVLTDGGVSQALTAVESYTGETVKSLKLLMNRRPPVALTVRLRSRDTGSADLGQDYAPVDRLFTFGPTAGDALNGVPFPIRIFSDRRAEGSETFELVVDPPVFGKAPNPAVFTITDPATNSLQVTPGTTLLREPVSGTSTQSVDFTLQQAFNQDIAFTPNRAVAGIGTQFDFPPSPVILKAGSNTLRIPVIVFADALDEATLLINLQLTANPTLLGLPSTSISILDATVPGITGDEGYVLPQGTTLTADGADGRPAGVQGNDSTPPTGAYLVSGQPTWGTVMMQPNGNFTVTPGPNAIGPLLFGYQLESIPYQQFVSGTTPWKILHPLNGINPAVANPSFNSTWATAGFDDSTWLNGNGTMSYGGFNIPVFPNGTDLAVPPTGSRYTSYFRTTFQSAAAGPVPLRLQLYCDDGAIIYINGVERGRAFTGTPVTGTMNSSDNYFFVTGGGQTEAQEGTVQNVNLGEVPLLAGSNVLAISLHNLSNTSSDLGLRVQFLETGAVGQAVPVSLTVTDSNLPPVLQPDTYACPRNATFLSSEAFGAGLLSNDSLLAPAGGYFDPITEITASPASVGTLELIGNTGHFRYTPPPDFSGVAGFSYQVRDKDGLSAPVLVTLNIQPSLPYDLWTRDNFLPLEGPGSAPDGDGWSNLLEYTLTSPPGSPANPAATGPYILAAVAGQIPQFSIRLRRASDLAWTVECAESLTSPEWTPLYESRGLNYVYKTQQASVFVNNSTSTFLNVTVSRASSAALPRLFYRVRSERISPQ